MSSTNGDEKILALTSRDIVAAEAQYHASCYKNYTRAKMKDQEGVDKDGNEHETNANELYKIVKTEVYANIF